MIGRGQEKHEAGKARSRKSKKPEKQVTGKTNSF
jgi:hypothetical protein